MASAGLRREAVVGGALTRWWETGPADADGTLVAVHGFRGDHHGLQRIVDRLPDVRIVSPDLPGFGESGTLPHRHTIAAYADWLIDFAAVTATRRRPFTVLGHSFGTIVVAAALDRGLAPDRVVLVNPIASPAMRGPKAIGAAITAAWYGAARVLPRRAGAALLSAPALVDLMSVLTTTASDAELRRWIREEHRRYFSDFATRDSVVEGFQASISDHVGAHAAAFAVPTLLIAADRDQITRLRDVEDLQDAIPASRLAILSGVGHLIHYERPDEAVAAIRDFLGLRVNGGPR